VSETACSSRGVQNTHGSSAFLRDLYTCHLDRTPARDHALDLRPRKAGPYERDYLLDREAARLQQRSRTAFGA
jgi:hypothetical protein